MPWGALPPRSLLPLFAPAPAPPAAAPEASERLAGHPLLAPAEMVKPDEEGAAAGGGAPGAGCLALAGAVLRVSSAAVVPVAPSSLAGPLPVE